MNLKKVGIITGSVFVVLYGLFLIVPFFLTGLVNSYNEEISKIVEETCGFKLKLEKLQIITTPKLTAGIKAGHISLMLPNSDEFLATDNAQATLSLIPLLAKRIELDAIKADNIKANLKVRPDGHLLLEEYIPESTQEDEQEQAAPMTELPYGIKLSNHLPNIKVGAYDLALTDMRNNKSYSVNGKDLKITDFIINKKVKISSNGSITLADETPFSYDIKVLNQIMPDMELNDMVFAQNQPQNTDVEPINFNIIDILEAIRKNQLTANLKTDITTSGKIDDIQVKGLINLDKLTLAVNGKKLPEGHVNIDFRGKNGNMDIALYTSENEATTILSEYKGGKNKKLNLTVKSNAQINNIFNIIKSIASTFNYNDLATLTATGGIDADFNLKSDMKKVTSTGYLKIPSASVNYGLYNVLINKINANIDLNNDTLDIKNIGFTILDQPLKTYGTIKSDTTTDIHLIADKLLVKGLITAAGQVGLLKDNDIKSGTVTVDASVKGNFQNLKPLVDVSVDNLNIYNKPSSIGVKLPKAALKIDEKDVNIFDTSAFINNSKIDVSGKISDYATKDLAMNIKAKGALLANDLRNMVPGDMRSMFSAKGSMPVFVLISGNDKKQIVDAQLLATPSGYFNITDVSALSGKNTLIRSNLELNGNNLTLTNTGLYVSQSSMIDETGSLNGLTQLADVSGNVDIASLNLNNLKIDIPKLQTISIPGFKNSTAQVAGNLTLNGNAMAPTFGGKFTSPSVSIPCIKTSLKDITVDFGNDININLPTISVDNSTMSAKVNISTNFSKGIVVKSVDFHGDLIDSDTLITAMTGMPAQTSSTSTTTSTATTQQDLGVIVQNGKGTVNKFKSGKIIATNLTSDFGLKNNIFYLKNLKGDAFSGKINGEITYNVLNGKTGVNMTGSSMKAVDAIEGAANIPNALSGTLWFDAKVKLNALAPTYDAMLKSVSGDVSFDIKDGHYANIGSLDQLLLAQNIAANTILKTAIAPIRNMPIVQNASNFSSLTGNLTLNNGIAQLKSVKSVGPSMAYFVSGNYNLINGYTNVNILGRLGADVVAALGPLGQLSVNKLTSYIPKFGAQTANIINTLTTNPNTENTAQIPQLTSGSSNTKDFKVVFNGSVTNPASIKSFKWLSVCDTSEITGGSLKDQLKTTTNTIKDSGKQNIQDVKNTVSDVKQAAKTTSEDIKQQVQRTKDSIQDLKNLKNMLKKPTSTSEGN